MDGIICRFVLFKNNDEGWTNFSLNMLGYLSILGEKYIPLRVGSRKIMNIILLLYKFTSLDGP